jgi:hypothetical protein
MPLYSSRKINVNAAAEGLMHERFDQLPLTHEAFGDKSENVQQPN